MHEPTSWPREPDRFGTAPSPPGIAAWQESEDPEAARRRIEALSLRRRLGGCRYAEVQPLRVVPVLHAGRVAAAARVIADAWVDAAVREIHARALAEMGTLGYVASCDAKVQVCTFDAACACIAGTPLARRAGSPASLVVETTLSASRADPNFGAMAVRWSVRRADDATDTIDTVVLTAAAPATGSDADASSEALLGHLQRAYLRQWHGCERQIGGALRQRVARWL